MVFSDGEFSAFIGWRNNCFAFHAKPRKVAETTEMVAQVFGILLGEVLTAEMWGLIMVNAWIGMEVLEKFWEHNLTFQTMLWDKLGPQAKPHAQIRPQITKITSSNMLCRSENQGKT